MSRSELGEIVNVLNLYAIVVDSRQWELLDRVFTADIRLDYLGHVWSDLASLKSHFVAEGARTPRDSSQHVSTNHHIVVNSDGASALSYIHAQLIQVSEDGIKKTQIGAWYDDKLVRTPAGWRIANRVCCGNWPADEFGSDRSYKAADGQVLTGLRRAAAEKKIGHLDVVSGPV